MRGVEGDLVLMEQLLLVTCLVAVLLQESGTIPPPQVSVKTKGKFWDAKQDTEKARGAQAWQPLEKDDQLVGLLPVPKLKLAAIRKLPGTQAWVEAKDILEHFRSPQQDPEPDLDSLYHPAPEEVQGKEGPWPMEILARQVLQGPEEDLDHIYHPVES
ncbi:proline-rich acidic protein 1 [Ctenodactylus gundi]